MKKKIRKIIEIIKIVIILLIVIAVGISKGREIYDNSHVRFADETMGEVICKSIWGPTVTPEEVTHRELRIVKQLDIGFSGYYKTLKDIKYCTEVRELIINWGWGIGKYDPAYAINQGKANKELSKEEIEETQKELGKILPRLSNLKILYLGDKWGSNWTSLDFLKKCDQIEKIDVSCTSIKDYSGLQGCTSLKVINLEGTQIFAAEQLKGLKNIESIDLYETPIAENQEELEKLQEMYPNAEIYYER